MIKPAKRLSVILAENGPIKMFILLSLSYFYDIIGFLKVDVMLKLQVGAVGCLKVLVIVRMECTTVVAL